MLQPKKNKNKKSVAAIIASKEEMEINNEVRHEKAKIQVKELMEGKKGGDRHGCFFLTQIHFSLSSL